MPGLAAATRKERKLARLCAMLADRTGSTVIEAALVLPVMVALGIGLTDVGRALWIQNSLQYAVEDAARCAAIRTTTCGTSSAIQAYAAARVNLAAVAASEFTVTSPACGKQVSVSHPFQSLVPGLVPVSVTLRAQSCHPA